MDQPERLSIVSLRHGGSGRVQFRWASRRGGERLVGLLGLLLFFEFSEFVLDDRFVDFNRAPAVLV